jgi:membrane-associated protease RseP (regulator of RpoE activity)
MNYMAFYFSVLGVGLVAVLFVHELGHLLAARYYGIKVQTLSVGFGPQLMDFTDRLGTSWKLRAFLIGGSCTFFADIYKSQKSPVAKTVSDKLFSQSWRRAVIYAAGPIFNLIFAAAFCLVAPTYCKTCALFSSEIGLPAAMGVRLIAEFSLVTGLFNLLPFLPLDGGRLCVTVIEARLGHPISPTAEKRLLIFSAVSLIGMTLAYLVRTFSA